MYTLGDIPYYGSIHFAERTAIVFEEKRLTYRELNKRVNRLAHALLDMGCKKGDHLAVLADNCSKYMEVYFAAAKIGVRVCPQNYRLSDQELVYIINHGESTTLMVGDGFEVKILELKPQLKGITRWISMDNELDGFHDYENILKNSSDAEPDAEKFNIQEDDLAILMYTGGTTGLPKGVMLSHRNLMTAALTNAMIVATEFPSLEKDTPFSTCYVLPVFHVSLWPITATMIMGGKVVINRKMDLGEILRLVQDEKCAHMNLVPIIYGWLVDLGDTSKYDLSSLISLSYAGSPFPPEVLKRCIQKFGNFFSQGYGATETAGGPITIFDYRDHVIEGPLSYRLSSAGKVAPCSRIKIVDEDDRVLPVGKWGEICVKGKHIMMGYWKNEEATQKALKGGWYHTGDIGYLDEDGYLFLTDRQTDMIISGGENVYPKETEDVLYQHPAVKECAVVSAPDAKWGEIVKAVIVLKTDQTATTEEIIAFCKMRLAGYKCPKSVEFWDDIPKSIIGKILKKDIKAKFWAGHDRIIG
ncbi:MAG: long-chain-fatty-acid--CoA ligase [Proteobacteria bacterium]|nr:long-chain-fatty-acid--CoA ligase [Pseudomonadota bacterium]